MEKGTARQQQQQLHVCRVAVHLFDRCSCCRSFDSAYFFMHDLNCFLSMAISTWAKNVHAWTLIIVVRRNGRDALNWFEHSVLTTEGFTDCFFCRHNHLRCNSYTYIYWSFNCSARNVCVDLKQNFMDKVMFRLHWTHPEPEINSYRNNWRSDVNLSLCYARPFR